MFVLFPLEALGISCELTGARIDEVRIQGYCGCSAVGFPKALLARRVGTWSPSS